MTCTTANYACFRNALGCFFQKRLRCFPGSPRIDGKQKLPKWTAGQSEARRSKGVERLFFLTMISPNLQLKWASPFPSPSRIFRHNCLRTEPPSSTCEHLPTRELLGREAQSEGTEASMSLAASPESPAARLGARAQGEQVVHQRVSILQGVRDHACHCRVTTGCTSLA